MITFYFGTRVICVLNRILNNHFSNYYEASTFLSSSQLRLDGIVASFSHEAANFTSFSAMTMGGLAYRVGKLASLSLIPKVLSPFMGLLFEVTAFEGTQRFLSDSNPRSFSESWRNSFVDFGIMKSVGHLLGSSNILLQHLSQDFSMVAAHQGTAFLGFTSRPEEGFLDQMLQAEVINLQLGVGSCLAAISTGHRLYFTERVLEKHSSIYSTSINEITRETLVSMGMSQTVIPSVTDFMGHDFVREILVKAGANVANVVELSEVRNSPGTYWLESEIKVTHPGKILCEHIVDSVNQFDATHYLSIQDHRKEVGRNLWSFIYKVSRPRGKNIQVELSWNLVHPDLRGNGLVEKSAIRVISNIQREFHDATLTLEALNFRILKAASKFLNCNFRVKSRAFVSTDISPQNNFLRAFVSAEAGFCSPEEAHDLLDAQKIKVNERYAKVVEILEREFERAKWNEEFNIRSGNILTFLFDRLGKQSIPLLAEPDQGVFFLELNFSDVDSTNEGRPGLLSRVRRLAEGWKRFLRRDD